MIVLRILLLVSLQAFFLRDVSPLGEWTRPEWTLWALLLIPPKANSFVKLILGFTMGVALDIATGSYGQHMVAGTVLGGFLPSLHRLFAPREGYEISDQPILRDMGSSWLFGLTFCAALTYHLTLMLVTNWYWHLMPGALMPTLTSAAFTTLCCLVLHLMVFAPDRRKSSS